MKKKTTTETDNETDNETEAEAAKEEQEGEGKRGTKKKTKEGRAAEAVEAKQPPESPNQGKVPWTAYVVVGALVALILFALTRRDATSGDTNGGGTQAANSAGALTGDGGLGIEDLTVGSGAEAAKGDQVKVHYVGTLTSGKEFDSSKKHGQPFDFKLGARQVIQGWDLGVAGMKVGGKRKLTVPPSLGYGPRGSPPVIPPNATLLFEVELLEVTKAGGNAEGGAADGDDDEDDSGKDDPLKGKFTLADATKNIKGTGALIATIDTSLGAISCRLMDDKAPITVANFIGLATGERTWKDPRTKKWGNKPAYDGTTFHRVIKGFMIQGGDPMGNGSGQPGYVIPDEIWEGGKHDRIGLLCMANRGHNTNGAQFFITEEPRASLDGNYTIFGECTPHQLIHDIAKVKTDPSDRPETPVTIKSVKISRGVAAAAASKQ